MNKNVIEQSAPWWKFGHAWMLVSKKKPADMTLIEKCQALLECSVPSLYWQKLDELPENLSDDLDMRFTDRNLIYYTFSELIQMLW